MQPHAYRLVSDSFAKKKAKKLVAIVELMGFDLKLSRAQEIVARLLGYDHWTELYCITKESPQSGISDQMLPTKVAKAREEHQLKVLADAFGIDEFRDAISIRDALAPTGDVRDEHQPSVGGLRLHLAESDEAWLLDSMDLVRRFDAAIRPLYGLTPRGTGRPIKHPLTHVKVQRTVSSRIQRKADTTPEQIVEWVAAAFPAGSPLAGRQLEEVTRRAKEACEAFFELDKRVRSLGMAPMLAPVDWVFLMLYRSAVQGRDAYYFTAVCPEPWLHIGFDLPKFTFNPENEWNASRALSLQLALRREFLDAGWTGNGQEWRVTFRDGNSAKEELIIRAAGAGAAFAWCAAARAALRLVKGQTVSSISLLSVLGPDGPADPEMALLEAKSAPIIRRGNLLGSERLRVRGRRPSPSAELPPQSARPRLM